MTDLFTFLSHIFEIAPSLFYAFLCVLAYFFTYKKSFSWIFLVGAFLLGARGVLALMGLFGG